jgi:hypothetical protein
VLWFIFTQIGDVCAACYKKVVSLSIDTGDFQQDRNTDHRDEGEDRLLLFSMSCLENVCVCEYCVVQPPPMCRGSGLI